MDRRNLILSGILVIQAALVAFLFWPNQGSNAAVSTLITGMTGNEVTGLTVQGDDTTLQLAKAGEEWVLSNHGDYPVNSVTVTDVLSKALAIDTSRLVASNAASHTRLQVADDEFVRKLDITTGDGQTHTLLIGSSPSMRATNVRIGGNDEVYLTDELRGTDIRTDVAGWINTVYLQAPSEQVQAVTIENANGKFDFTRVNTDTWTLQGLAANEVFNQNNFTTILTRLSGLNLVEPVGKEVKPEFGMDQPAATVTMALKPADGAEKTITLTIGAKDEGGTNYYAKSSDSEFYVKLATFTGDQFVNDTRDRYLQPPPTPEASSPITSTLGITTAVPITTFAPLTSTGDFSPIAPVTATSDLTTTSAVTTTGEVTATDTVTSTSPPATPTPRS